MRRKWIVLPVAVFGLIALSVGAYAAWTTRSGYWLPSDYGDDEEQSAETARNVQAYVRSCQRGREAAAFWLDVEVARATRDRDLPRLVSLCRGQDAPFRGDEEASLYTCRGLFLEERWADLRRVRELWRGREKLVADWLCLDADLLLRQGRPDEARKLLRDQTFDGVTEARRQARLALTVADAASARGQLARAEALAPDDPDVRDCRGRWYESRGRTREAEAEYAAALATRGEDLVLRDRLAECYRRDGNYTAAVNTLLPDGTVPAEFAWFKAWFWSRVGRPAEYDWDETLPDTGPAHLFAEYLLSIPSDRFWFCGPEYARVSRVAAELPETYWLRLLALLQAGREQEAAYVLHTWPFRGLSRDPDLEANLERILTFRAGQAVSDGGGPRRGATAPAFFRQLDDLASRGQLAPDSAELPADLCRLLQSDDAFAAALVAAGWDEAALMLRRADTDLSQLPTWYGDALVRALWANHGPKDALALVSRQPRWPGSDLVAGELLAALGQGPEALTRLRSATADADNGPRAAWLFAREALRQKKPAEARRMLEDFPGLTSDAEGQVLLARCAAAEGNDDLAERLYREVAAESAEARQYLAHRAMKAGDWAAAGNVLRGAGR